MIVPTREDTDDLLLPALSSSFRQVKPLPDRIVEFNVYSRVVRYAPTDGDGGYDNDEEYGDHRDNDNSDSDSDDGSDSDGELEDLEDIDVPNMFKVDHFESLRRRIFLGNLPEDITIEKLKKVMEKSGEVENVWIFRPPLHRKKFVQMSDIKFQRIHSQVLLSEENEDKEENILGDDHIDTNEVGDDNLTFRDVATKLRRTKRHLTKRVAQKHQSDVYAFVDMADWEGYDNITRPDVLQFGIAFERNMSKVISNSYRWRDLIVELEVRFTCQHTFCLNYIYYFDFLN